MSKGSKQRPGAGYAEGWDTIFGIPLICTACNTKPCECDRSTDGPGQDKTEEEVTSSGC